MNPYDANEGRFLRGLAEVLNIRLEDLTPDFPLNNDNWDSVAAISAIGLVDRVFGITVGSRDLLSCTSAGGVIDLVKSTVEGTGAE